MQEGNAPHQMTTEAPLDELEMIVARVQEVVEVLIPVSTDEDASKCLMP